MAEKTKKIRLFKNVNIILLVVSAFLALLIWITLSLTVFPETTVILKSVPIDFSLDNSFAEFSGLSIMSKSQDTVNLNIVGLRYQIGDYSTEDVHVTLNLDSVRASGLYDLPLIVTSVDGHDIQVAHEPQTIRVEFDHMITKTFSVEDGTLSADVSKITAAKGYLLDTSHVTISPSTVELYGPKDYIEQITSCQVVANTPATVKQNVKTSNTSLVMYNGTSEFESEKITTEIEDFQLEIPIFLNKDLKIGVSYRPYYPGFDFDSLEGSYTIEPESVNVISQDERLLDIDTLPLTGNIDIRQIRMGTALTVGIPESAYYTNISGVDRVVINYNLDGYSDKTLSLSSDRVKIIYPPAGYDVKVLTDIIKDIVIVGPSEMIDKITANDIVVELDFLNYWSFEGMRDATVTVYMPDYPQCWAYGEYRIVVNVVPETTDEIEVPE